MVLCVCTALFLGHVPYLCPLRPPFLKLNLPAGFFPGNNLVSCTGGFILPSFCHDSIPHAPAQAIPIAASLGAGCPRYAWPLSRGAALPAPSAPAEPLLLRVLLSHRFCASLSGERQMISEMAALHFCSISLQPLPPPSPFVTFISHGEARLKQHTEVVCSP